MPRKRGAGEIGVLAGVMAALAGCVSGPAVRADGPQIVSVIHTKAQPMSELRACVGPEETAGACVTIRTSGQREDYPFQPARVSELTVELKPGGRTLRWNGKDLDQIDDPALNFLLIKPSWNAGVVEPGAKDLLEVWLPFGFVRNQRPCATLSGGPQKDLRPDDGMDYAVFAIRYDGTPPATHIEKARCLTPDE